MKKIFLLVLVWLSLLFWSAKPSLASLVVVEKDGQIIWNILAYEATTDIKIPTSSSLEIKEVVNQEGGLKTNIVLKKEGGRISLLVSEGAATKQLDVTDFQDDIVEVEERGDVKRVLIGVKDGKFSLEQDGLLVLTELPINIDAVTSKFSVTTPSGEKFLAILPFEASQSVLRAKIISKIDKDNLNLVEEGDRDLAYLISGEKVINFFNLYSLKVPLSAKVSAATGEILFVNQPPWLKVLGLLFG